jgi:hypothetical protein
MKLRKFRLSLLVAATVALSISGAANAELIQHTDQIAEVKFTGTTYELGKHVGEVAKGQVLDGIDRFNETLGVMLPGLNVISLTKSFQGKDVYGRLKKSSPDAAAYIKGLSEALNRDPNLLLVVGMSDEAILESQSRGGIGFLQTGKKGHDPKAPAKCTVMGVTDKNGKAWAGANFDYMGINYTGLIILNHTDTDGKTRVLQTWAGLIPYGGISKGGQVVLMNTMADEGTERENAGGEIISKTAVPSYYLSWEAYNIEKPSQIIDMMAKHKEYTAFFSYTIVDSHEKIINIENNYGGDVSYNSGNYESHSNHSRYLPKSFVDEKFSAHTLARQKAADDFVSKASVSTTEAEVRKVLESKPLWKGRGKMMGTVTSTYYTVNDKKVDMYVKTDSKHPVVHIKNY